MTAKPKSAPKQPKTAEQAIEALGVTPPAPLSIDPKEAGSPRETDRCAECGAQGFRDEMGAHQGQSFCSVCRPHLASREELRRFALERQGKLDPAASANVQAAAEAMGGGKTYFARALTKEHASMISKAAEILDGMAKQTRATMKRKKKLSTQEMYDALAERYERNAESLREIAALISTIA